MKVTYAVLSPNQLVFYPGMGVTIKGALSDASYKGMEMTLTAQGLRLDYKQRSLVVPLNRFDFVEVVGDKKASK